MDDKWLDAKVLQILNVAGSSGADGLRLREALRHRVDGVSDEKLKSRLEEEFDVHDLVRRQAANEPVDVDEVLDVWADRKDSESYPYVLYRLSAYP
jgi:hypothetical protein